MAITYIVRRGTAYAGIPGPTWDASRMVHTTGITAIPPAAGPPGPPAPFEVVIDSPAEGIHTYAVPDGDYTLEMSVWTGGGGGGGGTTDATQGGAGGGGGGCYGRYHVPAATYVQGGQIIIQRISDGAGSDGAGTPAVLGQSLAISAGGGAGPGVGVWYGGLRGRDNESREAGPGGAGGFRFLLSPDVTPVTEVSPGAAGEAGSGVTGAGGVGGAGAGPGGGAGGAGGAAGAAGESGSAPGGGGGGGGFHAGAPRAGGAGGAARVILRYPPTP